MATRLIFLSAEILGRIVERLVPHYTVVYNRPDEGLIVLDDNNAQELKEKPFLKEHFPQVLFAEEIFAQRKNEVSSFNHLQLCLYALSANASSLRSREAIPSSPAILAERISCTNAKAMKSFSAN